MTYRFEVWIQCGETDPTGHGEYFDTIEELVEHIDVSDDDLVRIKESPLNTPTIVDQDDDRIVSVTKVALMGGV